MTYGHGDDIHSYPDIRINFSSNIYNGFSHKELFSYLSSQLQCIKNYPEPEPSHLEQQLAKLLNLVPGQVMVTSGVTDAIYLIAQVFPSVHSVVIEPTFAEYADACRMHGHRVSQVSSLEEIPIDADLCWICNPNNPTGKAWDCHALKQCFSAYPHTIFVIDASYASFTQMPMLSVDEAANMPNVLMLHSMTKRFSVPGLRLGYVSASDVCMRRLRSFRRPWTVGSLALKAASFLLSHRRDYALPISNLINERERVASRLIRIDGVDTYPSDTHILLCSLREGSAAQLKQQLACRYGILIRDASNFCGLSKGYFRLAVQSRKENDELVSAIETILMQKNL